MKKLIYMLTIVLAGMLSFGTANASVPSTVAVAEEGKGAIVEIVTFTDEGGYNWIYVYLNGDLIGWTVEPPPIQ